MTERQRLQCVLAGETPDRTPWFGDLSWWWAARRAEGALPEAHTAPTTGYLRMHQDAGVGIYLYAPLLWRTDYDETVQHTETAERDHAVTAYRTPVGDLRSVTRLLPGSQTSAIVEHLVKGPQDLAAVRWLFQHRAVYAEPGPFAACDRLWGEDGLACALAPISTSGLQSLLTRLAGVEVTSMLAADAPSELEATVEAMQAADDPIFRILCDSPAEFVVFPDNLSGEVTGRRLMRRYNMAYWSRRIEQLHRAGKRVGIHNDGTLRASLPLLVEAGFDIVEAATPAPVGDMTLEEIRAVTANRTIVWGGLPGALFSPLTSDETFEAFVRQTLETFPRGSGFVLGVADQAPPDAEWRRICRVREFVERWG
ncbi:MAG: hypothetical protein NT029_18285 [Armatimonadetes bacterium]|nr:hypothetical protein [Armatimonadota bacterium]